MNLHDFHFIRPLWLLALIPLAILLWRLPRSSGDGNTWRNVVDAHLLPGLLSDAEGKQRRLPFVLLGVGWLLGVLALSGPAWERLPQPVYQAQQFRVLVLDISPSMNAADMSPSRLAHARFELMDMLRKSDEGQTALIAYGAEPFIVSPLTGDVKTIEAQVPSLETSLLPIHGAKNAALALNEAGKLLQQAGAPNGEVILLTDRLAHPAAADEAASKLRAQGYQVSVLGIGSAKGAPVPADGGGFAKDSSGAIVLSKLDAPVLKNLAAAGGGRYVTASPDDRDIETLLPSAHSALASSAKKEDTQADQWREEGPWLLLILLPLAALGFRRGWLTPLLLAVFLLPSPNAHAFGWRDLWQRPDQQAQQLLQQGDAAQAAKTFQRPDWRAAAQYEAKDYAQSLQSLQGMEGAQAEYNKGNALARLGKLQEAVDAYDNALTETPDDADAKFNRDLVQKLLDQQKQQQNQKDQKGQENQQNQQDGQGQHNQGQQGQSQQDPKTSQNQQGQDQSQDQKQQNQSGEQGSRQEQANSDQQKSRAENSQQSDQKQQAQQNQNGKSDEKSQTEQKQAAKSSEEAEQNQSSASQQQSSSDEPSKADLLGDQKNTRQAGSQASPQNRQDLENQQAMEQMLRRVEDDPAGLLKQRFMLQHLRRSGQLPGG